MLTPNSDQFRSSDGEALI